MIYTYTHEISMEKAKEFAKMSRANLVRSLINAYKEISKINRAFEETADLTRFLNELLHQIEEINKCKNKTDHFETIMQKRLDNLVDNPQYQHISMHFDQCVSAIAKEAREAKDRDQYATQNKIATIKNNAVYAAIIPSLAAIAGGVLTVFSPIGLTVLAVSGVSLILTEVIFWIRNYKDYQTFNANVINMTLESDYAEGDAIPFADLPVSQQQKKSAPSPTDTNQAEATPVLISEDTDKMVHALIEGSQEVVSDVADALSASLYNMWTTLNAPVIKSNQPPTLENHLHSL